MSKKDAQILLAALVHDGLNVDRLTSKAKQEIRDAVDVILRLFAEAAHD